MGAVEDQERLRTVLDTNTVLSALLFHQDRLSWIRDLWTARRLVPLCSTPTTEELARVLAYPKFRLDEDEIGALVSSYVRYAEVIHVDLTGARLPRCRDPDDQMFLELAHCKDADVLVTGDDDLLVLNEQCSFAIETPSEFKKRFSLGPWTFGRPRCISLV